MQSGHKARDKAMWAYERAAAVLKDYERHYERVAMAHAAAVDAVPHVVVAAPSRGRSLTTADLNDVRSARRDAEGLRYVEVCAYDSVKENHAFVIAADQRGAQIAEIDRRLRWNEVNDCYDALTEALGEPETALLNMPAPYGAALLWKGFK